MAAPKNVEPAEDPFVNGNNVISDAVDGGKRILTIETQLEEGYVRAHGLNKFGKPDSFYLPKTALKPAPKEAKT